MIASIVSDKELVILIHNAYAYITRKKVRTSILLFDTYGDPGQSLWMLEYSFIQFTNGKIFK